MTLAGLRLRGPLLPLCARPVAWRLQVSLQGVVNLDSVVVPWRGAHTGRYFTAAPHLSGSEPAEVELKDFADVLLADGPEVAGLTLFPAEVHSGRG